jgi:hypothetical protein
VPRGEAENQVTDAVNAAINNRSMTKAEFEQALTKGKGVLEPKGDLAATTQQGRIDAAWQAIEDARPTPKTHLNSNGATGNFGVYEIEVDGQLQKVGKADLDRITQSSQLPTRLHQQVTKLEKLHGVGNVEGKVVQELGTTTTQQAKLAEAARLQAIFEETGIVPKGNEKSFFPKLP